MAPPRRSTRIQNARLNHTVSAPPTSFTLFPKLPLELRLQIFQISIHQHTRDANKFVPVVWHPRRNGFWSTRRPAALLHACKESRTEALKVYQLRFAVSSEQAGAGVYFSYSNDILSLNWQSLGLPFGRLANKISDEECKNIQHLAMAESDILLHADNDMIELSRFTGLISIGVFCDGREFGGEYGFEAMMDLAADVDEGVLDPTSSRTELWPELACLRPDDELPPCSKHWWFDGWNQRTCVKQRYKWPGPMAESFRVSRQPDEAEFLRNPFSSMLALLVGYE